MVYMAKPEPHIKGVMTPFPYAVALHAPLGDARRLMLEHRVRHLPVVEGQDLRGIITDRDIKLLLGPEMGSPDPHELTVEDAYVDDCYVVDLNTALADVLTTMAQRHIGAALVTKNGQLAGIFTAMDACRVFADRLHKQYRSTDNDPDAA